MKKVLILTEHFNIGGAEKALIRLLKSYDLTKYDINLMLVFNETSLACELPHEVKMSYIFQNRSPENLAQIQNNPREVYEKYIKDFYDIEIAYIEGYPTAIIGASNNLYSYKIAWVHIDFTNTHHSSKAFQNDEEEQLVYQKYQKIMFCSEAALIGFKKYVNAYDKYEQLFEVKYCLPKKDELKQLSKEYVVEEDTPYFCTLARLVTEKGLDRIIYAAYILRKEGYKFKCLIFGEGNLRDELQAQINELSLTNIVLLKGELINPYPYLKQSIAYVCSSIGESLCFAVKESLLLSVPVIACKSSGTIETLENEELGLLVDNSKDGVLDGMRKILTNSFK